MSGRDQCIESTLAGDPEMLELIEMFVDQMPTRVEAMRSAWQARDHVLLSRCAHQLKGASAGYGYETVGEAAGELERALNGDAMDESLHDQVEHLIDLCRRVVVTTERA